MTVKDGQANVGRHTTRQHIPRYAYIYRAVKLAKKELGIKMISTKKIWFKS